MGSIPPQTDLTPSNRYLRLMLHHIELLSIVNRVDLVTDVVWKSHGGLQNIQLLSLIRTDVRKAEITQHTAIQKQHLYKAIVLFIYSRFALRLESETKRPEIDLFCNNIQEIQR